MIGWLSVVQLLSSLESAIGDGARVSLRLRDEALVVRVDWPDDVWRFEFVLEHVDLRDWIDISLAQVVVRARHSFDTRVIKK